MPIPAIGLLLTAAVLHAGWNLLLKRAGDKVIILWWGMAAGALVFLPVLLLRLPLPAEVWLYAIPSAVCEAAYEIALASAYQREDFSLVYPIARGGAPAFLALWAILFLNETPSPTGRAGLVILTCGLMVMGASKWLASRRKGVAGVGLALAALVALIISFYSAIDGGAVKRVDPAAYTVLVFALTALIASPAILKMYGWPGIRMGLRRGWLAGVVIGCLSLVAYGLVLAAYSIAPVSYGGAIREISIVFGALAGWLWLKESFGPVRLLGAAVIFLGLMLIVLGG